ncbi:hypothetical protein EVAR_38136_1 [Eumeta japonica]|uniref:Mariner Mos1 transposase n=1 Tax=Eumeta variegata TaxID=151549 RepID=A0A4C1YMF0_EUMVA|nr:hypothetical protein EVAR_38136_1 [Eumeta japonica]
MPAILKKLRAMKTVTYAVFFRNTSSIKVIKLIGLKTVTAAWYKQHCSPEVLQTLRIRGLILNHGNASSHTAALTFNFLEENQVVVLNTVECKSGSKQPSDVMMPQRASSSSLMRPFVVLALPGMYLLYKYNQYRQQQMETARRRVTERELMHLNTKIVSQGNDPVSLDEKVFEYQKCEDMDVYFDCVNLEA